MLSARVRLTKAAAAGNFAPIRDGCVDAPAGRRVFGRRNALCLVRCAAYRRCNSPACSCLSHWVRSGRGVRPGGTESEMFSSATKPPKRLPTLSTCKSAGAAPLAAVPPYWHLPPWSWHPSRHLGFDASPTDEILRLALKVSVDQADNAVRRDDYEDDQQTADNQQIDRR